MSFWGQIVKGNSSYVHEWKNELPICNLVLTQATIDRSASEPSTLYIETEGFDKLVLCTLSWGRCEQARIDLLFEAGREVKFSTVGKGDIHLTGYYVTEDTDQDFSDDDLSDQSILSDESEDLEEETPKGKRRISIEEAPVKKSKKEKQSPKTPKDSPKKTGDANSCVTCNKSFSTPEALSQHKNFKHGTPSPVEKKKKRRGKEERRREKS